MARKKKEEKIDYESNFSMSKDRIYGVDIDEKGKPVSRICKRCGNNIVASYVDYESEERIVRQTKEGRTLFRPSKFYSHGLCPRCLRLKKQEPDLSPEEWAKEKRKKDKLLSL